MNRVIFLIVLVVLPIIVEAQNQDSLRLSLDDYRQRVVEYSYQLKEANEATNEARSALSSVKSGIYPQLSASVDFNYLIDRVEFEVSTFNFKLSHYNYGAGVTLAQSIYKGGQLRKSMKVAESAIKVAGYSAEMTSLEVGYGAERAYWGVAAIDAYYDVAERYLSILKETYSLVDERYKSGLISKNDLLLIQTRLAEAQGNYTEIEGKRVDAIIMFNILMGINHLQDVTLVEDIYIDNIVTPLAYSLEEVLLRRPDYKVTMGLTEQLQQQQRVIRSNYLPQFVVGVTGNYQTQTINFDDNLQLNGAVFAQLKVPLFAGGSKVHKLAQNRSQIRQNEYQTEEVRDMIRQEMATTLNGVTSNIKQLEVAKVNLDSAQESLELSSYSYNEGQISIIDLMQSQVQWLTAVNGYILACYNYRIALSNYYKAMVI